MTLEAGSLGVWAAWGLGLRGKLESLEAGSLWAAKLEHTHPSAHMHPGYRQPPPYFLVSTSEETRLGWLSDCFGLSLGGLNIWSCCRREVWNAYGACRKRAEGRWCCLLGAEKALDPGSHKLLASHRTPTGVKQSGVD